MSSPSRPQRLRKPGEFTAVFSGGRRLRGRAFAMTAMGGVEPPPRLGLAISKRVAKRAIDRNRLKRLVRESFRAHPLPPCWVVVTALSGAPALPAIELRADLERLWQRVSDQCAAS